MGGDQFVARKRGAPIALAACDKDDLALFVGEPIERLLDGEIGAPLSLASARVCQHVGLILRPLALASATTKPMLDCITSLHHGGHQARYLGVAHFEQGEIRSHRGHRAKESFRFDTIPSSP